MDSLHISDDMLFIAADGDGIGKLVGRAVIANDTEALHKISARIDAAQDFILHWAKQHDGIKISGGGDEFTAAIPKDAVEYIESLRKDIEHAFGYTISVGVGKNLSEAGTALLVAKLRGKNQIVHFTDEVKKDIKKAKRRVREKRATPDENKLAEAYLNKGENMVPQEHECPYCAQTDGVDPDHCKYCHDADQAAAGGDDCPYCVHADGAPAGDDCPYCVESAADAEACPYCAATPDQNVKIQSPDSNNAEAPPGSPQEAADYAQMDMNPPGIPKPQVGDGMAPTGLGQANPIDASGSGQGGAPVEPPNADPAEIQANDGIVPDASSIPQEGAHSKEALQAIATQIQNETAEGLPSDRTEAENIDDTAIIGNDMEGNASRPAGYGENTPGDMGLEEQAAQNGESGPNFSSVLKEGLDSQADDIEKDKVRDMVGQALTGFKANKQLLENAKVQAPAFYQSSIAMLAAMIRMAEMLGLGSAQAEQAEAGIADWNDPFPAHPDNGGAQAGAPGEEDTWQEPFPAHPDQGGVRKPGHAPSKEEGAEAPKGDAPIGQPIGKLPSKATKHVARTPMPPGAINAKGQQKVIDPKTGKTRFIDRKSGMVQSPTGVPIKPPGRGSDGQPQN